jgi:hypothetical protein
VWLEQPFLRRCHGDRLVVLDARGAASHNDQAM